ncbi:MAG TPA: DUF1638 domain-containing protein [Terriglobales bacterium]|nr:DUF1638 domain-containing protein [Terriglobales bacterium]
MKAKLIACRVLIEEMRDFIPEDIDTEIFDISQHTRPKLLKDSLQSAVDRADGKYDTILLGYGLCSNSVVGLKASHSQLVIPRMHDCIGILLGSHHAYLREMTKEPAFFLTKGYINGYITDKCGPMEEMNEVALKYGRERAERIVAEMMKHYSRLVYIRPLDPATITRDEQYAHAMADHFGMRFEERDGVHVVLTRLVSGEWNHDFVVVPPGQEVTLEQFMN